MDATLDQVLEDVNAEPTQIASLSTLILALKQQVADALAGITLPQAVQLKVNAIFDQTEKNKQLFIDAINATTEPAPEPAPEPAATTRSSILKKR